jgi:hypothetical protein
LKSYLLQVRNCLRVQRVAGGRTARGTVYSAPRRPVADPNAPMQTLPPLGGVNVDGNKYNGALPYDTRFDTGNIDQTYSTAKAPSRDRIAKPAVEEDLGMPRTHARL